MIILRSPASTVCCTGGCRSGYTGQVTRKYLGFLSFRGGSDLHLLHKSKTRRTSVGSWLGSLPSLSHVRSRFQCSVYVQVEICENLLNLLASFPFFIGVICPSARRKCRQSRSFFIDLPNNLFWRRRLKTVLKINHFMALIILSIVFWWKSQFQFNLKMKLRGSYRRLRRLRYDELASDLGLGFHVPLVSYLTQGCVGIGGRG